MERNHSKKGEKKLGMIIVGVVLAVISVVGSIFGIIATSRHYLVSY